MLTSIRVDGDALSLESRLYRYSYRGKMTVPKGRFHCQFLRNSLPLVFYHSSHFILQQSAEHSIICLADHVRTELRIRAVHSAVP
jgi:hypothetical protein